MGEVVTFGKMGPPSMTIVFEGKTAVVIKPDGTVEFGEGYNPEEAAKAFWYAVGRNYPGKS